MLWLWDGRPKSWIWPDLYPSERGFPFQQRIRMSRFDGKLGIFTMAGFRTLAGQRTYLELEEVGS